MNRSFNIDKPNMAKPATMAIDGLPRFLLPRLSWTGPAKVSQALRPLVSLPSSPRRQLHTRPSAFHGANKSPRCRNGTPKAKPASILESPGLTRLFHATPARQRDHHFDTLKFVQRLKSEGFTEVQAEAMMKVLNDVIQERYAKRPYHVLNTRHLTLVQHTKPYPNNGPPRRRRQGHIHSESRLC